MPGPSQVARVKRRTSQTGAPADDGDFVNFTVDAALLRELGERLVGRPEVALAELVKNAYDPDATKVRIVFSEDTVNRADARKVDDLIQAGARLATVSNAKSLVDAEYAHGTTVEITRLNDVWDVDSIRGLAQELWFLNPPLPLKGTLDPSKEFSVEVEGLPDEEKGVFDQQLRQALDNWIAVIDGKLVDGRDGGKAEVTVQFRDGQSSAERFALPNASLDRAQFEIRVFKLSHRQPGEVRVSDARAYFKEFGGVHIYDDGFRLPFYGGEGEDWLGLEVATIPTGSWCPSCFRSVCTSRRR